MTRCSAPGRGPDATVLRVCLVTGEYPPDEGGVADYTRCLAYALAAEHVAVDVVTTRRAGRPVVDDTPPGCVPNADGALRRWVNVHRVVGRSWSWAALAALRRAVAVLGPDVLHVQYQAAAYALRGPIHLAGWWARRGRRTRSVVTYHDLRQPYLFPRAGSLRRRALFGMAKLADMAIATNAEDYLRLAVELPDVPLALVPIGSNVADAPPDAFDRDAFRANAGIAPGTGLIAYFGFLNESKGARVLAEALARLLAEDRDARLVMVGGAVGVSDPTNAEGLARFEAAIEDRGIETAVRWTGHLAPAGVSAWLHAADVAALPYRDGASYRRGSLLAALAHGLPVVTTAPPVFAKGLPLPADEPPSLEDGTSALLVPPDDPEALALAIARVLDEPATAERLSRGARTLSQAFAWPAIAARHVALYRSLAGEEPV